MDTEHCPQCHHQLTPGDNFCASCGASLRSRAEDERSAQLVPDLPNEVLTNGSDSTPLGAGVTLGSAKVRQFFENDFVGTAFVIVLQIVTLGIWPVHYMKQLTDWLNDAQPDKANNVPPTAISPEFMAANFVFAYTNAGATLLALSDAENLSYYVFSSLVSIIAFVLHVIWAFKLRASLQILWQSSFGQSGVLSGFLTFVLGVIYLNFKILSLKAND